MIKFLILLILLLPSRVEAAVTFDVATNLSDMVFYDASGGTYTARNTTTGDYFDNDSAVGDCIILGWDRGPWHTLTVNVGTQLVADSITVVWEFQDSASVWTALAGVTDNTNAFQNAGSNTVVFTVPDSWHYQASPGIGGIRAAYGSYIRARITAVTNISEGGANATDVIQGGDWAIQINDAGTRLSTIQTADDAGAWGMTTTYGKYTAITSNIRIVNGGELFIRNNEVLEQGSNTKRVIILKEANTLFQMGDATSGYSEGSMFLYWNNDGLEPYNYLSSNVNIYNSTIVKRAGGYGDFSFGTLSSAIDMRNSVLSSMVADVYMFAGAAGTLENVTIDSHGYTWFYVYSSLTISNLILADVGGILAGAAMTLSDVDFGTAKIFNSTYASIKTLLNCNFDTSYTAQINASYPGATALIKYTVSLTIVDEDGVAIATPTVVLTDAEGTDVFSGTWSTDFDATVWKEIGGVETDYNPFTITVSKAGYRVYTGVITIDKKTDFDIILDKGDTVLTDVTLYDSVIY